MKALACLFSIYCVILSITSAYGNFPKLLFANTIRVGLLDTATGNATYLSEGNNWVMFVDYHYAKNYIFFTDQSNSRITRMTFSPYSNVVTSDVIIMGINPVGIAVDYINDHIYWTDMSHRQIFRSDLDGLNTSVILNVNSGSIRDIALDLENRWMFFNNGGLEKSRLDGTERHVIISQSGSYENIVLDFNEGRVYWVDYYPKEIKSAFFDGSDVHLVISLTEYPMGLEVIGNYIYYSLVWQRTIHRFSRDDNTSVQIFSTDEGSLMSLKHYKESDVCSKYRTIDKENKRSADYVTDMSLDIPYSDDTLEEGWYRIRNVNGDKMPITPPGTFRCGTYNPIWLNGSFPNSYGDIVSSEACLQTSNDICEESFNITIRSCRAFYLYYLQNTTTNAAYCFGTGAVKCAEGFSSESGFYPGCSSSFPNDTVLPVVEVSLVKGLVHLYGTTLEPAFSCEFDELSNESYVYDVYWYINGENVTFMKNVPFIEMNSTILKEAEWKGKYHMNMEVSCSIRLRYSEDAVPSPFYQSSIFKAGLYPEKYEYTVVEGESIKISLRATVPVGCFSSVAAIREAQCYDNIYVYQPKYETITRRCSNNIANRDILLRERFCGVKLSSIDVNETKYLDIYGFSDGLYNHQDRSTYIRFYTKTNSVWQSLSVPDIKVTVLDKDSVLTTRLCQCYNDPHITTFDGRIYHYMEIGEFVLYRNDNGPYWVHALFTNCGYGWEGSSCNCGIAIRSRNSLFVLRTCEKISRTNKYLLPQPITDVRSCDESDLSIEHSYSTYKITLPIGTEIQFSISQWSKFINGISIKPSVFDIDKARGLCGYPSLTKDSSDDFYHRELGPISEERSFADSWRIDSTMENEQLFVPEPQFLFEGSIEISLGNNNSTQQRYCICEQSAQQGDDFDLFNTLQCNLTESTESCLSATQSQNNDGNINSVGAFVTTCSTSYRQKRSTNPKHKIVRRSTSDSDDVLDIPPLEYDSDTQMNTTNNTVPSFRNGWTEEKANKTCHEQIHTDIPDDLFGEFTGLTDSDYIESCIMDIKMTASTSFLQDTVGAMQTYAVMEVLRNETLSVIRTGNGSETILEYITNQLCIKNCSGNGNCSSGVCSCYDGYIGADCSQQVSTPPSDITLPAAGLCGTRSRACRRTNIYGTFLSVDVWCKKRYFQVINNEKSYIGAAVIIKADYRNTYMVSVDLKSSRRKRSTDEITMAEGYELSLSNDGSQFSDNVTIIIYDEECFDCNSSSIECVVLDTCPEYVTTTDSTVNYKTTGISPEVTTTLQETSDKQKTTSVNIASTTEQGHATTTQVSTSRTTTETATTADKTKITSTETPDESTTTDQAFTTTSQAPIETTTTQVSTTTDTTTAKTTTEKDTKLTTESVLMTTVISTIRTTEQTSITAHKMETTLKETPEERITTDQKTIATISQAPYETTNAKVSLTSVTTAAARTKSDTTTKSTLKSTGLPTTATQETTTKPTIRSLSTNQQTTTEKISTEKISRAQTPIQGSTKDQVITSTERDKTTKEEKWQTTSTNSVVPTDKEQLVSYTGPIVLGSAVVVFGAIAFLLCLSHKLKKSRSREKSEASKDIASNLKWTGTGDKADKYSSWRKYDGKFNKSLHDERNYSMPDLSYARRVKHRVTDNENSFFDLYVHHNKQK